MAVGAGRRGIGAESTTKNERETFHRSSPQIFTGKYESETNNDPFTPSRVIQRLRSHPSALTTYLEHAVFKLQIQTDEIHTMLVNIYLDQILAKSDDENEEIR